MGRKYFLWGMIIMLPVNNALSLFLEDFSLDRDPKGIESQLNDSGFLNGILRRKSAIFDHLNKLLSDISKVKNCFLTGLQKDKTYNTENVSDDQKRFNRFINIVKGIEPVNSFALMPELSDENDQDKNNDSDVFFSVNNIKKIFLDFAKHREQIDSSLDEKEKPLTDDAKVHLVNDVLSDCYKMLAIFYFGGVLSAKNLNSRLKDLESIKNDLNENIIMPGRWETFCYAVKRFFQSLISDTKRVSLKEAENEIQNIKKAKSVFDKLKQTADCLHKDNEK